MHRKLSYVFILFCKHTIITCLALTYVLTCVYCHKLLLEIIYLTNYLINFFTICQYQDKYLQLLTKHTWLDWWSCMLNHHLFVSVFCLSIITERFKILGLDFIKIISILMVIFFHSAANKTEKKGKNCY